MAVRYCIARKGASAFTVSGKILTFCGQWRKRDRVFATRMVATCKRCRDAQEARTNG